MRFERVRAPTYERVRTPSLPLRWMPSFTGSFPQLSQFPNGSDPLVTETVRSRHFCFLFDGSIPLLFLRGNHMAGDRFNPQVYALYKWVRPPLQRTGTGPLKCFSGVGERPGLTP